MTDTAIRKDKSIGAPGEMIRSLRKRLKMTLGEVSQRTGIGVSTLSKLEKGHASLSFEKLQLLSRGLDIDLADLLRTEDDPRHEAHQRVSARRIVQRAGEGLTIKSKSYDQAYLASDLLRKRVVPIVTEVRSRSLDDFLDEFGGFIHHPGEEFSYVLEGRIAFHTEAYAPVELGPGDSVYFDSDMGHAYLAVGDAPCRLLSVCFCEGKPVELTQFIQSDNVNQKK